MPNLSCAWAVRVLIAFGEFEKLCFGLNWQHVARQSPQSDGRNNVLSAHAQCTWPLASERALLNNTQQLPTEPDAKVPNVCDEQENIWMGVGL